MTSLLGLDVGSKFTGIAISRTGIIAEAYKVVSAATAYDEILKIAKKENVKKIIIGMPVTNTKENTNVANVKKISEQLTAQGYVIEYVNESLTTGFSLSLHQHVHGKESTKDKRMDATAAAFILQRYIDVAKGGTSVLD